MKMSKRSVAASPGFHQNLRRRRCVSLVEMQILPTFVYVLDGGGNPPHFLSSAVKKKLKKIQDEHPILQN